VIRDRTGPRVLFYYYGKYYDLDYDEFLSLPFFDNISLRKLKTESPTQGYVSSDFRNEVKDVLDTIANSWPSNLESVFRDGVDIVLNYWVKSGVGNVEKMRDSLKQTVRDVDCIHPKLLGDTARYSPSIIIRTPLSRAETTRY
jgi:hypothetical protein